MDPFAPMFVSNSQESHFITVVPDTQPLVQGSPAHAEMQVNAPTRSSPGASMDSIPIVLFPDQLPALLRFSGDSNADEVFDDWLECLELVAA